MNVTRRERGRAGERERERERARERMCVRKRGREGEREKDCYFDIATTTATLSMYRSSGRRYLMLGSTLQGRRSDAR